MVARMNQQPQRFGTGEEKPASPSFGRLVVNGFAFAAGVGAFTGLVYLAKALYKGYGDKEQQEE